MKSHIFIVHSWVKVKFIFLNLMKFRYNAFLCSLSAYLIVIELISPLSYHVLGDQCDAAEISSNLRKET